MSPSFLFDFTFEKPNISLNELMDELLSFGTVFFESDFPDSTIRYFYLSKLYEYLNNSTITYNFEEILLPFQNHGFFL